MQSAAMCSSNFAVHVLQYWVSCVLLCLDQCRCLPRCHPSPLAAAAAKRCSPGIASLVVTNTFDKHADFWAASEPAHAAGPVNTDTRSCHRRHHWKAQWLRGRLLQIRVALSWCACQLVQQTCSTCVACFCSTERSSAVVASRACCFKQQRR